MADREKDGIDTMMELIRSQFHDANGKLKPVDATTLVRRFSDAGYKQELSDFVKALSAALI